MTNVTQLKARNSTAKEEVAAAVRSFIARAGVSKSAVAREIGMAQSTFSRRTTGLEPFDTDELGTLADYFGVSLVDLIGGNILKIAPNAKKAPTANGEGQMLLDLDSNQEPTG
ncbi:MAG: helix-turn-helix domain-containing protein [Rhodoglobus sp.]